jgi:hypothetical protein
MRTIIREALVVAGAALCVAGPVAAILVPLAPAAWRRPSLAWAILLASAAAVACVRRRRWRRP